MSRLTNKTPNLVFFEKAKAPVYLLTIEGTGHLSFTDVSFYGRASFFRLMSPVGEIDGEHCHKIVCDYVRAFLDKHFRGGDSRLLDGTDSRRKAFVGHRPKNTYRITSTGRSTADRHSTTRA